MKKIIIIVGGTLLIVALMLNLKICINKSGLSETSLLSIQNTAMALPESTNDGTIANNDDCLYPYYAKDPFTGEWHYYEAKGHSTSCFISWLRLGCDAHPCIPN